MHRAVFLDRDGTLIVDRGYLDNVAGVELLPGVGEALARLAAAGFLLVVVSNQSGVGRGYFEYSMVEAQHRRLQELLAMHGVRLAAGKYCPHAPDQHCPCRKPKPQMLIEAAAELEIDLSASWMIGDKASDVEAGQAATCQTILLGQPGDQTPATHLATNLPQAVDWILQGRLCSIALSVAR